MPFRSELQARTLASDPGLPKALVNEMLNVQPNPSSECLQFLTDCFNFNPDQRPDADTLRSHAWLKDVQLPQACAHAVLLCTAHLG